MHLRAKWPEREFASSIQRPMNKRSIVDCDSDWKLPTNENRARIARGLSRAAEPVNGPSDFHRVCLFSGRRRGQCVAVAWVVSDGACSSKKWVRKRAIDVAKRRPVAQGLADRSAHAARRTRINGR